MLGRRSFDARLISNLLERVKRVADDGAVRLHELTVPESFGRLPHCFRLQVFVGGHEYSAWGTAKDRDEAAAKCVAELIERMCLRHSYPVVYKRPQRLMAANLTLPQIQALYPGARNWIGATSSGVALHSATREAVNSGIAELIERHTILKALAARVPPFEQEAPAVVREYSIPEEIGLRFLLWKGALGLFVCACQIRVKEGAYYSFGTGRSAEFAAEKAFFEGAGMIGYVPDESPVSNVSIRPGDLESFQRYHRYSPDRHTFDFLDRTSDRVFEVDPHISRQDFFYSECAVPGFLGDIRPLVCVRVLSPLVQPLFFDEWKWEYLNPAAGFMEGHELPQSPHIIS